MTGVDLEASTTSGPGHHWDKRIMFNDYMVRAGVSSSHGDVLYTSISLAALQDTGWYSVDISLGHSVTWGY
jgi:hypothetical protein